VERQIFDPAYDPPIRFASAVSSAGIIKPGGIRVRECRSWRFAAGLDCHKSRMWRQVVLQPMNIVHAVCDVGMTHQIAEQRYGRFDTVDDEF
jgi:hypothetical protein